MSGLSLGGLPISFDFVHISEMALAVDPEGQVSKKSRAQITSSDIQMTKLKCPNQLIKDENHGCRRT